ncbi:hypothetical protein PAPYR_5155 [Paratrimastix pyriformis]|uniref:TmcB/TmcC TPR repeats domain-containing protein n=1 Tax=Paratrimastix pyriformis TaxID=342808 RepID=A0ABQ8UI36_9EUKA|nr:hypothetical protein PAPYR_5155 [Paratrimastix pyriformis]
MDSPMPRFKALLFVLQFLQLFFLVVAVPTCFFQTNYVAIPLFILDFSFAHLSLLASYITFAICGGLVIMFIVLAMVLGALSHKDSVMLLWPLRILKGGNLLFLWVLFIPFLGSFLDIVDCRYLSDGTVVHDLFPDVQCWQLPHALPSVFSLLVISAFLLAATGSSLFVYPSVGFDRRSRGRFDLLVTFCKCILLICARLLTVHTVLRSVLMLLCTAGMLAMCLLFMPYHTRSANILYVSEYWIVCLAALEWVVMNVGVPGLAGSWVPFVGLVGAAVATTPFVGWLAYTRYNRAMAVSRTDVRRIIASRPPATTTPAPGTTIPGPRVIAPPEDSELPQTLELAAPTTSALDMSQPSGPAALGLPSAEQVIDRCRFAFTVEWATRFLQWSVGFTAADRVSLYNAISSHCFPPFLPPPDRKDPASDGRLIGYAKAIFSRGLTKFPESHGLLLNYAEFLTHFLHNPTSSIAVTRRCATLPGAAIDTRFCIYSAERTFEQAGDGAQHSGFMSMLTLRRHMREAQIHHKRAKNRVARVWTYLMRPKCDMRGLPPLLDSAVAHANTALAAYSSLLQSFPSNTQLLRLHPHLPSHPHPAYGSLFQDLYGDSELSESLFAHADQLEEDKTAGSVASEWYLSPFPAQVASQGRELVEVAYQGRKLLEVLMESSAGGLPIEGAGRLDNVTFGADTLVTVTTLTKKLLGLSNVLSNQLVANGAALSVSVPWTTAPAPVLLPVASGGALTSMGFDTQSLWTFTSDFASKAFRIGLAAPAQLGGDLLQSELLYLVFNGPLVLAPALIDSSLAIANSMGSTTMIMVSKQRKSVLSFYFGLPKEVVQREYSRLQKRKESDETGPS